MYKIKLLRSGEDLVVRMLVWILHVKRETDRNTQGIEHNLQSFRVTILSEHKSYAMTYVLQFGVGYVANAQSCKAHEICRKP